MKGHPCMSRSIRKYKHGFSLTELLTASVMALLVFMGAWSVYVMGWSWWHETLPRIEAQGAVRLALGSIINGLPDDATGSDTVNSVIYARRNGVAWATSVDTPQDVGQTSDTVVYDLEGANNQSFFLDAVNNVVCHNDANNPIKGTSGITALTFERVDTNLLKVTAAYERDVIGTRSAAYHIKAQESETVFLRNLR